MFMGEFNHSIDAKGRVIIPVRFREQLGDSFVLTQGLDGCLNIYDNDSWEALTAKLAALPMTNKPARTFKRFIMAKAVPCELDKQGRILIPASLRSAAGLDKDVILAGVGERIEIWNAALWEENTSFGDMDEIAEQMEGLGI